MSTNNTVKLSTIPWQAPGRTAGEWLNFYAFAATKDDGSVLTWGQSANGGDSSSVSNQLNGSIDVTQIYSSFSAFAALRADGSVITWGDSSYGGDSSSVATQLNGSLKVTQIYSTDSAFAAVRTDGSVITWGNYDEGGDSSAVAAQLNGLNDVTQIASSNKAFAALRNDGSVVTWGDSSAGGDSSTVVDKLNGSLPVTQINATNWGGFAAIRSDGSVVTWGNSTAGGESRLVANQLTGVVAVKQLFTNWGAFAALYSDGSVVTWGNPTMGGDSSSIASQINGTLDVTQIVASAKAFSALRSDGSVVSWGYVKDSTGVYVPVSTLAVSSQLDGSLDVVTIAATTNAFAALRSDGSVVTWGDNNAGGDSSTVANQLNGSVGVKQLVATTQAFAALRTDGSVITWGSSDTGGDSSQFAISLNGVVDVTQIYSTGNAFAALRSDGSIISWGNVWDDDNQQVIALDTSRVASQLGSSVIAVATPASNDVFIANHQPTGTVTLSDNSPDLGQTLTASNTLADADGLGVISYQWMANGALIGTGNSYTVTTSVIGQALTVTANYTDGIGIAESVASAASALIPAINTPPTLSRFTTNSASGNEDSEIAVTLAGLKSTSDATDTNGEVTGFIIKQLSNGSLRLGANSTVATAWDANTNNTIDLDHTAYWTAANNTNGVLNAFTVLAKDATGLTSSTAVQTTINVIPVNDPVTGDVSISGRLAQGQTLTATNTLNDVDGLGIISYTWQANGIVLGKGATYTITAADVGKSIAVTASFTDLQGNQESKVSLPTATVTAISIPKFIVTANDLSTNESGDTAVINVTLATKPTRDVVITFVSSDITEGTLNNSVLTFTTTNWASPQAITVTGQNDALDDGTQPYVISASINTTDVNYRRLRIDPLMLSNKEDVTTTDDPPIPIGTPRDIPLVIYGDAILDKNSIDPESGLYETIGSKPINDILHGLDGNDTIYGGNLQDDLSGGLGDDTLYGENDEDHLYGEAGNDTLFGGSGIDTLEGGAGNDVLNGGDGDLAADVLIGGEGNDTYYLGYGALDIINDNGPSTDIDTVIMPYQLTQWTLSASIENCTIADGTSNSKCIGNANNNALTGNAGNNTLSGETGNDSLSGGLGNDTLIGGDGNDTVSAGEGNDEIIGGNGMGDDDYFGDKGIDTIKYTSAITSITVDLNKGTSTGKEIGMDQLHGIENIIGGQAGDMLIGDAGNNVIDGYTGNDTLNGGGGNNTLIGGLGNDYYFLTKATDIVSETSKLITEIDTVNCPMSYSLGNNLENLVLTGSLASNGIGNALNNTLTGNTNNNILSGGAGQDLLIGGLGADSLSGGLDADRFKLNSTADSGITTTSRDSIMDFNPTQGDKIDLSALDANSASAGDNAFTAPMVGSLFSGVFTNQGSLYFDTTSHILYGNNDADNQADFSILLVGQNGLSASSLIL